MYKYCVTITFHYSPAVLPEAYVRGDPQSSPVMSHSCHTEAAGHVEGITIRDITVDDLRGININCCQLIRIKVHVYMGRYMYIWVGYMYIYRVYNTKLLIIIMGR